MQTCWLMGKFQCIPHCSHRWPQWYHPWHHTANFLSKSSRHLWNVQKQIGKYLIFWWLIADHWRVIVVGFDYKNGCWVDKPSIRSSENAANGNDPEGIVGEWWFGDIPGPWSLSRLRHPQNEHQVPSTEGQSGWTQAHCGWVHRDEELRKGLFEDHQGRMDPTACAQQEQTGPEETSGACKLEFVYIFLGAFYLGLRTSEAGQWLRMTLRFLCSNSMERVECNYSIFWFLLNCVPEFI